MSLDYGLGTMTATTFPIDRSRAVPLLQFSFPCVSVISYVCLQWPYLLNISPSVGALEGPSSAIVAFSGYPD